MVTTKAPPAPTDEDAGRTRFTTRVPDAMLTPIDAWCAEHGVSRNDYVLRAMRELAEKQGIELPKEPDPFTGRPL